MFKKPITGLGLCFLALFAACSDSDIKQENEQLEKELAAEKSKTVTDIKKVGDTLVITYSNGTTQEVSYTTAIQGNLGVQDGVGIKSIVFNEVTGILTITLTNSEVTEFKVSGSDTTWTAVLIGDTNGRLFIDEVVLGAVPVVKARYDESFQLTYLEGNMAKDMQTRKVFDMNKVYENGKLSSYVVNEYALRDKTMYTSVYHNANGTTVAFNEYKGQFFKVNNSDGTFKAYEVLYQNGTQYFYTERPNCIAQIQGQPGFHEWVYSRKISENKFNHYESYREFTNASGVWEKWFSLYETVTITGSLKAGSIESTESVKLETDAAGRITKMYESESTNEQPQRYMAYNYNAAGLVKDSKEYVMNELGAWVAEGSTLTYNYNANNKLTSTTETNAEGTTKEVQRAVYDAQGNPTEIWAWQEAEWEYVDEINPVTGERGYESIVREAGIYQVGAFEYDYTLKNFFGNTITALVPELDGYKTVNALKRVTIPNNYSYGNIEYKEYDEFGYPRRVFMTGAYLSEDEVGSANLELLLHYKVKP